MDEGCWHVLEMNSSIVLGNEQLCADSCHSGCTASERRGGSSSPAQQPGGSAPAQCAATAAPLLASSSGSSMSSALSARQR